MSKFKPLGEGVGESIASESRSLGWYLGVFFKGMAMGAADVVPGVSGGTVAFISGIYALLIDSIQRCTRGGIGLLLRGQLVPFWRHINGTFLSILGAGILISVAVLARFIHHMLIAFPQLLWGFFLGLIVASSYVLFRHLPQRSWREGLAFALGVLLAIGLSLLSPVQLTPTLWVVGVAGMIAICAMILPGISGSFLLLLMGLYQHIITAVKAGDWVTLAVFGLGCGVGLMAFSRVVAYFLSRHPAVTLATLTGFMVGALVKVWPWQYAVAFRVNPAGELAPTRYELTLPQYYEGLTGAPPMTISVLALIVLGGALVLFVDWWRARSTQRAAVGVL